MALRHPIPRFAYGRRDHVGKDELAAVPLVRAPVIMQFTRGFDPVKHADEVLKHQRVEINAAPGVGKSTVMPVALAARVAAQGGRLFHVVPSRLLAADLHDYVVSQGNQAVDAWEAQDVHDAKAGLVHTAAGSVVAALLEGDFPRSTDVLYLDEVHESDAYMFVLSKLGPVLGFSTAVTATATGGPAGFSPLQVGGGCSVRTYEPDEDPSVWNVQEKGKPWYVYDLTGHLVIFSDDFRALGQASAAFKRAGMLVYQLTARTPVDEFRQVMRRMRDPRQQMSVFVMDYSFRSGYTLDAQRVIDLCAARVVAVQDGHVQAGRRRIYAFESYQASARVGRVAGQPGEYFRPACDLDEVRVVVEGVEADAAAMILALLGWDATMEVAGSVFAGSKHPIAHLWRALDGPVPLVLLATSVRSDEGSVGTSAVTEEVPRSEVHRDCRGGISDRRGQATPPATPEPSVGIGARSEDVQHIDVAQDQFLSVQSVVDIGLEEYSPTVCEWGKFYTVEAGLEGPKSESHGYFGTRSISDVFEREHGEPDHLPIGIRAYAVKKLLVNTNMDTAEVMAMMRVLQSVPQAERERLRQSRSTRQWIADIASRAATLKQGVYRRYSMVAGFAGNDVQLYEIPEPKEAIQEHERVFMGILDGVRGVPDVDAMLEAVSRFSRKRAARMELTFRDKNVGLLTYRTQEGFAKYDNTLSRVRPASRDEPGEYQLSITPRNVFGRLDARLSGRPTEVIIETHVRRGRVVSVQATT